MDLMNSAGDHIGSVDEAADRIIELKELNGRMSRSRGSMASGASIMSLRCQ